MKAPLPLEEFSETQFDAFLFGANKGAATELGWDSFHALKMRGSKPGYPDRTFWRERIALAELKVGKNKPSSAQVGILDGLARAGGEVYLWFPEDWDEIGRVLGRRWRFARVVPEADPVLFTPDQAAWTPRSLWIPGVGRADSR